MKPVRSKFSARFVKPRPWSALLSQEGSTIETAVEIVRRVVPEPDSLKLQSETFCLGNYPSRHRKEHDDAALLTQVGNSPAFTVANVLCVRESEVVPNQFNPVVERIRYVDTMVLGEFMIEDFKTCGT